MSASSMTWEGGDSGKACHRACDTGWGRAHANWWHGVGVAVTRLRAAWRAVLELKCLHVEKYVRESVHLRNSLKF